MHTLQIIFTPNIMILNKNYSKLSKTQKNAMLIFNQLFKNKNKLTKFRLRNLFYQLKAHLKIKLKISNKNLDPF